MELYSNFASHYDAIFPVNEKTVTFLQQHFAKGILLDLGCATGGYVAELSALGYSTKGLDLDANMITEAKKKHPHIDANFYVSDLLNFDSTLRYQGIFCIGNTLVHLSDESSVRHLFRRIYHALEENGTLILQIVNYDRILDKKIESLPTIEMNGRRFERLYRHESDTIVFQTVLTYQKERYEAETILMPLSSQQLVGFLQHIGFSDIQCFGGFDGSPYHRLSSFSLVVVAKKEE